MNTKSKDIKEKMDSLKEEIKEMRVQLKDDIRFLKGLEDENADDTD